MKHIFTSLLLALISLHGSAYAQDKKMDFNVRAGFAIGAATPLGIPVTIRKIESYNPGLMLSLEAGGAYRVNSRWSVASAIRFEQKGMTTEAQVKGYYTTFNAGSRSGSESITGYYTGTVVTKAKNSYLTIPVHAVYHFGSPFSVRLGGFMSLAVEKSFTGSARDGYLRDKTPVGEKEEINEALYDFSDEIRPINAGIEAGLGYRINDHLTASALASWGITPLMKKDFESIDFNLYNLCVNIGLAYRFR